MNSRMREVDIKSNQHHSPQKITAQYKAQVSGAGASLLQKIQYKNQIKETKSAAPITATN